MIREKIKLNLNKIIINVLSFIFIKLVKLIRKKKLCKLIKRLDQNSEEINNPLKTKKKKKP